MGRRVSLGWNRASPGWAGFLVRKARVMSYTKKLGLVGLIKRGEERWYGVRVGGVFMFCEVFREFGKCEKACCGVWAS